MRKHLGNLGLLISLLSLLAVPLATYKFMHYTSSSDPSPVVLGVDDKVEKKSEDKDDDKKEEERVFMHPSNVVRFFR